MQRHNDALTLWVQQCELACFGLTCKVFKLKWNFNCMAVMAELSSWIVLEIQECCDVNRALKIFILMNKKYH